jgi:fluoride exporter
MSYLWVMIGSALGGLLRFTIGKLAIPIDTGLGFPLGTVLINIIGSFVIGYFGTLTLHNGKYPVSENMRIFVMVGICGGFTTFSSFSLQSFDLARSGAWGRALANVVLSVVLCLAAVAAGHRLAQHSPTDVAIAETAEEKHTG